MTLMDVLTLDLIRVPLEHSTKEQIIGELVEIASAHLSAEKRQEVLGAVLAREHLGSTGLSDGIAIPHAKTNAVSTLTVAMGITRFPVDFEAQDGKPSQFFFLVLAPERESSAYIEVLASIARTTASPAFRRLLAGARTAEEVLNLFLD